MIRDYVLFEELSPEAYQKLFRVKRELQEEGIEVLTEKLVAVAIEVAGEEKWKKKIMERE